MIPPPRSLTPLPLPPQALDRAFRRGWEAFITNLYSVTLTPVTSPSPKKEQDQDEFHVTNRPL